MSQEFEPGDKVLFNFHTGLSRGTVQEKITEDTEVDGRTAHASKDDPQYIIKRDKTGGLHNRHPDKVHPRDEKDDK